jgi:6-phosphogluconolactonase
MTTLPPPVADVPEAFTETVCEAFASRPGPRFTLVLSGGPTAKACYENLYAATSGGGGSGAATSGASGGSGAAKETAGSPAHRFDWSLVDIYMGDERIVPPDDPDANQRLVREAIVDRVPDVGSFTPMPTAGPPEQCAADYQRILAAVRAGPGIDLIHLGLGSDGHTASLFPGAPTLDAGPDELVAATEDPNGRNPHPRLTVTLPVIDAARLAVITVTGDAKRDAIAALRRGDDIPAARVSAERVVWLVDRAAYGVAAASG